MMNWVLVLDDDEESCDLSQIKYKNTLGKTILKYAIVAIKVYFTLM